MLICKSASPVASDLAPPAAACGALSADQCNISLEDSTSFGDSADYSEPLMFFILVLV